MSVPAVLYRISTAKIIKRSPFPGDPTLTLPGLDPDYVWLIIYTPFPPPDYDVRLFSLDQTETITNTPHPDFPLYSQFLVTFATNKLPTAIIAKQVANAERAALERAFPAADQMKTIILGLGVLAKLAAKLDLDPDEQKILADVVALSDKVWVNSDNAAALKVAAEAGQPVDLDANWAAPAATP